MIAIALDDPLASAINNIEDLDNEMPGLLKVKQQLVIVKNIIFSHFE